MSGNNINSKIAPFFWHIVLCATCSNKENVVYQMRIILTLQIVLLTDLFLPHFIYKQKWSLNELVLQCVTEVVLKILSFSLRFWCPNALYQKKHNIFCLFVWRDSPQWARTSSFTRFLDHTQRGTTVGWIPLDEWSARRRDLYLTTQHSHQTNIHAPVGIRSHDLNRRVAADLRLRPHGHWDRQNLLYISENIHHKVHSRMGVDRVSWGKSCRDYLALFRH